MLALRSFREMKVQGSYLYLLSAVVFLCSAPGQGLRRVHFGECTIAVNMHEIRDNFQAIKSAIQAKDVFRNSTILSKSESLHNIKPSEKCCLAKHLLQFYVEKVFKHYDEGEDPTIRRRVSRIANSFFSIKESLKQCKSCHCKNETTHKYQLVLTNYEQLEVKPAAIKCLGELDILLSWMDKKN
ncbi:interleukin-19 [Tachyglossus aculeatus]|uniref:interleukin-19 n=1 Tax=Tachyglossus aculeatus TaxID=9261 RepID=UPI0018F34598|nr:interleukin-19 [Tachyglossus aculeatus]